MSDDRYARVYFDRIARDEKFDGIRENRALMGAWLMCLVEAEKAWPSPAFPLPTSWVPARDFRTLAERGIVDLQADGRYRMHGLDAIRAERSRRGADAAAARWGNAGRNASGNASASAPFMPRRDETRKDETSSTRATDGAWETASGRSLLASGNFAFGYIDDAVKRHGDDKVADAIRKARKRFDHIPETNALAAAVKALLDPFPDQKAIAAAEREAEQAVTSRRGVEATLRRLHYTHTEPRPDCPACRGEAA
jgi:hypothetical protein